MSIFKEIQQDDIILQEREFYAKVSARLFDEKICDDEFIMQGVIDLVIAKADEIWILDYKTGKISDEKLKNYGFQLKTYADIAQRAFGKKVTKMLLCFVDEQKILEI